MLMVNIEEIMKDQVCAVQLSCSTFSRVETGIPTAFTVLSGMTIIFGVLDKGWLLRENSGREISDFF